MLAEYNEKRKKSIELEKEFLRIRGSDSPRDLRREQDEINRLKIEAKNKAGQAAMRGDFGTRNEKGEVTEKAGMKEADATFKLLKERQERLDKLRAESSRKTFEQQIQLEKELAAERDKLMRDSIAKHNAEVDKQIEKQRQLAKQVADFHQQSAAGDKTAALQAVIEANEREVESGRNSQEEITRLRRQNMEARKRIIGIETQLEIDLADDVLDKQKASLEGIRKLRQADVEEARRAAREKAQAEAESARERARQADEMAGKLKGSMTGADAQRQAIDIQRQAQEQIARLNQQMMQSYVTGDVKGFFEGRQQMLQIEQQFQEQMKKLREQFSKDGNAIDKIKSQLNPQDVLKQIMDDRLKQQIRDRAKDDPRFRQGAMDAARGGHSEEADAYRKQFEKMQRDMQRQVQRDFRRGRIGEDEAGRAMDDLVRQGIDSAQQAGQIDRKVAEGMQSLLEGQRNEYQSRQQMKADIEAIVEDIKNMKELSKPNTARARARGGW